MAGALRERSSSATELSSQLAQVQAACSAACQPAVQSLQSALATLVTEGEPAAAALAASLQTVAGLLQGLPSAEADLPNCVSSLGQAVSQLAAGYAEVAGMAQERHKVRLASPSPTVCMQQGGDCHQPCMCACIRVQQHQACKRIPSCGALQVFQVLSSVNARLEQAAAANPSRLQLGLPGGLVSGCNPGAPAGQPSGSSWQPGGGSRDTLVKLLQQMTDSVVGLIEGLAVEKECLESQMLQAHEEARQLRRQVCTALPARCLCVFYLRELPLLN